MGTYLYDLYIYIYIYMLFFVFYMYTNHICMYLCIYAMYVYTYMVISATALCAFGVTGLDNFAFRLLLSDFWPIGYNRPPLIRTAESFTSVPPRGPPLKNLVVAEIAFLYLLFRCLDPSYNPSKSKVLLCVPSNIHVFTFLQTHRIS